MYRKEIDAKDTPGEQKVRLVFQRVMNVIVVVREAHLLTITLKPKQRHLILITDIKRCGKYLR